MTAPVFAHSAPGLDLPHWETLEAHAQAVAERAAGFAAAFGWSPAGEALGALHDIGKVSPEFQAYIRSGAEGEDGARRGSVDHSTAGARESVRLYGPRLGRLLAFIVAGHHAGLADADTLKRRLDPAQTQLPDYAGWDAHAAAPAVGALADVRPPKPGAPKGFAESLLVRMLFSCLVDADFLETERFYAKVEGRPVERGGHEGIGVLADRLQAHLATMRRDDTPVNRLRSQVLDHATAKADLVPGLFTLTVPTGGGKTLTSLSFALEHARRHGLRRVVYVIPFTSIIEQTAQVFRDVLGAENVLEHSSSFDWEAGLPRGAATAQADAAEGGAALAKLRRAAENWDAPIVVTTAVQFFESLFANRTSRCRKLHNLAGSVIVLDEAQTLPLPLLRPCLAALAELERNYGASLVLCTATQPAVRVQDGKLLGDENKQTGKREPHGLNIPDDRELAPEPRGLYEALKRVEVEVLPGETDDATVASRLAQAPQMLCIVNSRAHARALYDAIAHMDGAVHLSTLMCPVHRARVLAEVRTALKSGRPARVVSTSLIEAGVDISFPEVWRASTGLDSIAQAAGRCNRNDELAREGRRGRAVVFKPALWKPPRALELAQAAAANVLRRHGDLLGYDAVGAYFGELYARKDFADLDSPTVVVGDVSIRGVLRAIETGARDYDFPFKSVAEAFRLIDEVMEPAVVPYDDHVKAVLARVAAMDRPLGPDLQTLQRYTVSLPRAAHADWMLKGVITCVRPDLGATLTRFADMAHYREATGIDLASATQRNTESNVIS